MTRMTASVTVEDGRMLFDGVDVAALGDRVGTPFFLYSQRRIAANVAAVRRAFQTRHAPTRVFFAGKACSNLWFLEQVRAAGALTDDAGDAALAANRSGELLARHERIAIGRAKFAAQDPPLASLSPLAWRASCASSRLGSRVPLRRVAL